MTTPSQNPPPPPSQEIQEGNTPRPSTSPPLIYWDEEKTLPRPTPPPYPFPPPNISVDIPDTLLPSSIPPWPGAVDILDMGSATRVPDHTELTPGFLRWFDDLYQNGHDLTVILDHSEYFQDLSYSCHP